MHHHRLSRRAFAATPSSELTAAVSGTKLYSMRWDDFLVAIIELVLLKFGSAPDNLATLADAVDGLVLAYCHQRPIQLSASDSDAYMRPEVMDALLEHDKLLQDLFWYYSAPDEFSNSRMMSQEQVGGSTVCGHCG